jgi:integrase
MALVLYRRHAKDCPKKGERANQRGCKCGWWFDGTLFGREYRKSAKTRSYEGAVKERNRLEHGPEEPTGVTFKEASERFMADIVAQGRESDTVRKYRHLFAELRNHGAYLHEFDAAKLLDIRASWKNSAASNNKRLDRLKRFFRFCHESGWVGRNASLTIKPAKNRVEIVKPFSREEQAIILSKPQVAKIRCFVHTLYHAGLRISDCCFLKPADFDGSNIVRVNRKNKVIVFIPIPPALNADLDRLPLRGGYYFLIGASTHLGTQTDAWRSTLRSIYSDIPDFHPHRFRHTRVVEWLAGGLSMEEISGMIGTSIRVLERHYSSFAPARRTVVTEKLSKLWEQKPKLVRVK